VTLKTPSFWFVEEALTDTISAHDSATQPEETMRKVTMPIACDECFQNIGSLSEGMVEWIDDGQIQDVRIVHHPDFSPRGNCYKHTGHYHRQDNHLQVVMGIDSLRESLGISLI
jgi:hypothetical protein